MLIPSLALGLALHVIPASWTDIGNDLWNECHGTPVERAYCKGLIAGVASALQIGRLPDIGARICLPDGDHSAEEFEPIVMQYLKKNWNDLEASNAIVAIAGALDEKFPCRKPRR